MKWEELLPSAEIDSANINDIIKTDALENAAEADEALAEAIEAAKADLEEAKAPAQ